MSFIRPEARDALRRYGEPALYAAVTVFGFWQGISLLWRGNWVGILPLFFGLLALFAVVGAIERALVLWRGRARGPGVVSVHEGRISYFGPLGGGVLAMDALTSVEIVTTDRGPQADDLTWHLRDEIGQHVIIPGGADGTTDLLDRLGSLPGFDHMAVITAMGSTGNARFPLWRRDTQSSIISS